MNQGSDFWRQAITLQGSITPRVFGEVIFFGLYAFVIMFSAKWLERYYGYTPRLEVALYEVGGAALSLILILRTNAGYDRWWEARKLWGGIVNQSRNLAISGLSYGPRNLAWQRRFITWAASFAHIARHSLRGEPPGEQVVTLLGQADAAEVAASAHMPSYVALKLADLLHEACGAGMDRFAFLQIDRERALLIDHIGACERILKTPLPLVYAIKVRRFLLIFLLTMPFALMHQLEDFWLVPILTMLIAYPLLSLDRIGIELQNPFTPLNLSHLPLTAISDTIERNLTGLLTDQTSN